LFTLVFSLYVASQRSENYSSDTYTFFDILVFAMVCGFVYGEFAQFSHGGFAGYFKSFWNSIDAGIVICYSGAAIGYIIQSYEPYYCFLAFAVLLLWIRLFHLMTFNRSWGFGPLIVALRYMGIDIINFIFLTIFFGCGFAAAFRQATTNSCPPNDSNITNITCSVETIPAFDGIETIGFTLVKNILGGQAQFEDLEEFIDMSNNSTPIQGYLILGLAFFYLITSSILLINMLIAMMGATFGGINDKKEEEANFAVCTTQAEYIDPGIVLPAPLNIITYILQLFARPYYWYQTSIGIQISVDSVYCHHCHTRLRITKRPKWPVTSKPLNYLQVGGVARRGEKILIGHESVKHLASEWIDSHVCPTCWCVVQPDLVVSDSDVRFRNTESLLVVICIKIPLFLVFVIWVYLPYAYNQCFRRKSHKNFIAQKSVSPHEAANGEKAAFSPINDSKTSGVSKSEDDGDSERNPDDNTNLLMKKNFPDDSDISSLEQMFPSNENDLILDKLKELQDKFNIFNDFLKKTK
jgi:hypothetical protein